MGVNGSGKTTLLRILNGSYTPDRGRATLHGRVGALVAAGAGFSPMLSGRENVFISGTLLGMHPQEIHRKFDEIVDFSGLEEFIDMPVRNYSSGMSVRLGFAIAVMGSPDILLVDEVLAVGDISFQKKCYERLYDLKMQGVTVILVSHSIGAIWSVCNRGIFLDQGLMLYDGTVEETCRLYDETNTKSLVKQESGLSKEYGGLLGGTGSIICTRVFLEDLEGEKIDSFKTGDNIVFAFSYKVNEILYNPIFRFSIDSPHFKMFFQMDSVEQGFEIEKIEVGDHIIRFKIKNLLLRPGAYSINTSVTQKGLGVHLFYGMKFFSFEVTHSRDTFFYASDRAVMHGNAKVEIKNESY